MLLTLLTLAHILVFTYWLGGDLGAFYVSFIVADRERTVQERGLALKVLSALDMAPRSALILALPTGWTLAAIQGWWAVPAPVLLGIWIASLAWLALAWAIHLRHAAPGAGIRTLDLAVRCIVIAGLAAAGGAGLAGRAPMPLFVGVKLLILCGCIALGLIIRRAMAPMNAPLGRMLGPGPSEADDAVIRSTLARVRPVVLLLWALLLTAAAVGVAKPGY